jgi:hypothetical protein
VTGGKLYVTSDPPPAPEDDPPALTAAVERPEPEPETDGPTLTWAAYRRTRDGAARPAVDQEVERAVKGAVAAQRAAAIKANRDVGPDRTLELEDVEAAEVQAAAARYVAGVTEAIAAPDPPAQEPTTVAAQAQVTAEDAVLRMPDPPPVHPLPYDLVMSVALTPKITPVGPTKATVVARAVVSIATSEGAVLVKHEVLRDWPHLGELVAAAGKELVAAEQARIAAKKATPPTTAKPAAKRAPAAKPAAAAPRAPAAPTAPPAAQLTGYSANAPGAPVAATATVTATVKPGVPQAKLEADKEKIAKLTAGQKPSLF